MIAPTHRQQLSITHINDRHGIAVRRGVEQHAVLMILTELTDMGPVESLSAFVSRHGGVVATVAYLNEINESKRELATQSSNQ